MVAEVFSGMIQGIEGQIVQIQADISNGLPNFYMTGYLSNEVKESKERVRTALHNIGIALPPKRISVNFAPADFRKCGTFFDLAVAVAILLAMNLIPETYVKNTLFIGECRRGLYYFCHQKEDRRKTSARRYCLYCIH